MRKQTNVNYSEVPVADVAAFFVAGYQMKDGETLVGHSFFYDPTKGVFVFKLITEVEGVEE